MAPSNPLCSSSDPCNAPHDPAPEPRSVNRSKVELVQVKRTGRKDLLHLLAIPVGCMQTLLGTSPVGYKVKSWERALGRAQGHDLGEANISFCLIALENCKTKTSSQSCV